MVVEGQKIKVELVRGLDEMEHFGWRIKNGR